MATKLVNGTVRRRKLMKRRINNSHLKLSGFLSVLAALVVIFGAGSVFASCPPSDPSTPTVTIGGNVFEGSEVQVGVDALGFPIFEPVYAPTAPALTNPQVMVQNIHSGGEFICYAPVTAGTNSWSAEVAIPGDYVVIVAAAGHDTTSREFKLDETATTGVVGSTLKDAYLAPFPRNTANLLLYAFRDNYANSEDDFPVDTGLAGVTFTITHEDGATFTGVSGSQTVADMPQGGAGPDMNGLYYFTNIPYGEYDIHPDPSTVLDQTGAGWHLVLEEGGTSADALLRPGDPGTLDRAYLVWFGFIEKQGQLSPPPVAPGEVANVGTISGTLIDADGNAGFLEPFVTDQACPNSGVNPTTGNIDEFYPDLATEDCISINLRVPEGFVVLWDPGAVHPGPLATTLADPVTGEYEFVNVPPGAYKLFVNDVPGDYIWQQQQVNVVPNGVHPAMDVMVPRWFARANGHVFEVDELGNETPYTAPVDITMRLKSGSVWQRETTDPSGYYNFDNMGEKEAIGALSVVLPDGYRGVKGDDVCYEINTAGDAVLVPGPASATVTCHTPDLSARNLMWFTANYRQNLKIEKIPAAVGHVRGFVYNDHLEYDDASGNWLSDGLYDVEKDRTLHGLEVRLLDESGAVVATTTTGKVDEDLAVAQGLQAGPIPIGGTAPMADEAGRIFKGPVFGQYDFRDVAPGNYTVEVDVLEGFSPSPAASDSQAIVVAGGARNDVNLGMNTLIPLAGEIEGGIFDDVFLDTNPMSSWMDEKRKLPGLPLGMYDEFGYKLAVAFMQSPLCFAGEDYVYPDPVPFGAPPGVNPGDRVCPAGEELYQSGEIEVRANSGVHSYFANDPTEPGYHSGYESLALNYGTKQGQYAYETEWALVPTQFLGPLGMDVGIIPANAPIINNGGPTAMNLIGPAENGGEFVYAIADGEGFGIETVARTPRTPKKPKTKKTPKQPKTPKSPNSSYPYTINGSNFGAEQGHSTVSLSGVPVKVDSWSDTQIVVLIPRHGQSGPLIVSTTSGPSNAFNVTVDHTSSRWTKYLADRTVHVTANAASGGDGSVGSPVGSINAALQNLPRRTPRYVMVGPGVYKENVKITQSDVFLIGAGPYKTMIDGLDPEYVTTQGGTGTNVGPAITIGNGGLGGGVSNVMVSGFTITGGTGGSGGLGGGVFGDYGNNGIDINNNIIGRNGGEYGGGVWLHNSNHNVRIWSNIIAENGNFGGYGGGISVADEPEYEDAPLPKGAIEPTDATHHTYDDELGLPLPGTYEIFNNVIFHNFSMDYGGGVSLYEVKDHMKVYGNAILENRSDDHGGGMFLEDTGPADIYDNVFLRNSCPDDGGAISFEDVGDSNALMKIYNNLFAENIADDRGENHARGGALSFDDTLYVEIFNNTIVGNIVAGSYNPAGGGIDSERHGHEYGTGFSDPKIYNNIIWGNWRLKYEAGGGGEGSDYASGINYVWTPDNLHVDNPAVNGDFETYLNSESFTHVKHNIIGNGEYSSRRGNISQNPLFVDPANLDWSLQAASPAIDRSPAGRSPETDLLLHTRSRTRGKVDLGALEYQGITPNNVTIPTGIMGAVQLPIPGSTEME